MVMQVSSLVTVCAIRYLVVELNRIRSRLPGTRREAQTPAERPQGPQPRQGAGTEASPVDVEPASGESSAEIERVRSELEGKLEEAQEKRTKARAERNQAQAERDSARAELEAARAELSDTKVRLEAQLARSKAKRGRRSQRKFLQDRAEAMIAHLQRELQAERERREDLELALQLLEDQMKVDTRAGDEVRGAAMDAPYVSNGQGSADHVPPAAAAEPCHDQGPANATPEAEGEVAEPEAEVADPEADVAEAEPEPKPEPEPEPNAEEAEPEPEGPEPPSETSQDALADGWGVPLEAFPVTDSGDDPEGGGSGSAGTKPRSGPRRRLRRGGG
jgi:hypothetical protein